MTAVDAAASAAARGAAHRAEPALADEGARRLPPSHSLAGAAAAAVRCTAGAGWAAARAASHWEGFACGAEERSLRRLRRRSAAATTATATATLSGERLLLESATIAAPHSVAKLAMG
jgi:hypothetical protein